MKFLFAFVINLTLVGSVSAQKCFLKTDTIYLFIAQTQTDIGTNGIIENLEDISFSYLNRREFFCSFCSSLSFSHPFVVSLFEFLQTEADRKEYSECLELEDSRKQNDKALKRISKHYRNYRLYLEDGTEVRLRVIKLSTTLLVYERNNNLIIRPIAEFDDSCYRSKYSYFYTRDISWVRFSKEEERALDKLLMIQRK